MRGKFGEHVPLHLGKFEAANDGSILSPDNETMDEKDSAIPFEDYGVPFNLRMRRMDCTAHPSSTIYAVCGKNEREQEKRLLESWIKQETEKRYD